MRRATTSIHDRAETIDICEHCIAYYFDFVDGRPAELAYYLGEAPLLRPAAAPAKLKGGACPDCSKPLEPVPDVDGAFRCPTHCSVFVSHASLRKLAGLTSR